MEQIYTSEIGGSGKLNLLWLSLSWLYQGAQKTYFYIFPEIG